MKQEAKIARAYKGELSREEILHLLDLDKQMRSKRYPQWLRDSLDGVLRNPKLAEQILSDLIEYKYSPNGASIATHPNITSQLLDKMVDKGYADTDILHNKKTSTATLSKMYSKTSDFHTRGFIVNHNNASDEIVVDFINAALADKNKDNIYWAISRIHKIPADIFRKMSRDSDQKMRLAVANNYYAPVDVINILTEDTDSLVAYGAKENLRLRYSTREDLIKIVEDDDTDHKNEQDRIKNQQQQQKETSRDYLIQKDIEGYEYSKDKLSESWVLNQAAHFKQDHVDTTREAYYSDHEKGFSAFVQVTKHEPSDSDYWLLHEIEYLPRLKFDESSNMVIDFTLRKGVTIKNINGNRLYHGLLSEAHKDNFYIGTELYYIWISNRSIIQIEYFRRPYGRGEPIEVVQAYLQKYPSSIPPTLVFDRAHNIKWIKDEMERRLWLLEKWSTSSRGIKKNTIEMHTQFNFFLYYREKCFGKKAKSEKEIIAAYADDNSIKGLQDKMIEYKEWWKNNKTKSIDLCIK